MGGDEYCEEGESPSSSNPVTLASHPPPQVLTLALPIQAPLPPSSAPRDDCWSPPATSALLDAWADRFLLLRGANLRQKQWQEVADAVTSRQHYSKTPKSHAQCKNRIDTLKKKYKLEKSKPPGSSSWPFFNRLHLLLGASSAAAAAVPKKQRSSAFSAKRRASESSDSPPPPIANGKPRGGALGELKNAILRFGEVYQRVESSKLKRLVEMERQRMEFSREIEEQRMSFFLKAQIELSKVKNAVVGNNSGMGIRDLVEG